MLTEVKKIMRLLTRMILIALVLVSNLAAKEKVDGKALDNQYDPILAERLGADEYGMRAYILVILTTGPNDEKITDKALRKKLFQGHFANMGRLANNNELVLAGPLINDKPKRGLFILNVKTKEEAEALVKTDPAVEAGIFNYELSEYYGSAALMQVNRIHHSIQRTKIE